MMEKSDGEKSHFHVFLREREGLCDGLEIQFSRYMQDKNLTITDVQNIAVEAIKTLAEILLETYIKQQHQQSPK